MSPIANMLVQIRNAQSAGLPEVLVPFSALKASIAHLLVSEGFIKSANEKKRMGKKIERSFLSLATVPGAIHGVRMISKPSRRLYAGSRELAHAARRGGTIIMSTPQGIMTSTIARAARVGGEMMFEIW